MSSRMKQRQARDRKKRTLAHQRENGLFFAHGTFPASARTATQCRCGARAFSRDAHDNLDDFREAHEYCHD
ncbi:MAG: hypothetical protein Q8M65_11540 [Rhodoglobus sp.]|nr:hypothetical protein [Rhodoglobus sp.]